MTKKELARMVTRETGISYKDVLLVIDAFADNIRRCVSIDEPVMIKGFGTFYTGIRNRKWFDAVNKKWVISDGSTGYCKFKASRRFRKIRLEF